MGFHAFFFPDDPKAFLRPPFFTLFLCFPLTTLTLIKVLSVRRDHLLPSRSSLANFCEQIHAFPLPSFLFVSSKAASSVQTIVSPSGTAAQAP